MFKLGCLYSMLFQNCTIYFHNKLLFIIKIQDMLYMMVLFFTELLENKIKLYKLKSS